MRGRSTRREASGSLPMMVSRVWLSTPLGMGRLSSHRGFRDDGDVELSREADNVLSKLPRVKAARRR